MIQRNFFMAGKCVGILVFLVFSPVVFLLAFCLAIKRASHRREKPKATARPFIPAGLHSEDYAPRSSSMLH
jgi:hypothetical protein